MKSRRYLIFFIAFPMLLLPTFLYVGIRLFGFSWQLWPLSLPFLSVALFPFFAIIRGRKKNIGEWLLTQAAYLNMGTVTFLLLATAIRDILGLVTKNWLSPVEAIFLAIAILVVASFRGIFGPSVRKITLRYPELPEALAGMKIAQISDLHISGSIGVKYVSRVVRKTLGVAPDLIALTGDIGDGRTVDHAAEIEELVKLAKDHPVFYVPGNHEVYWNHLDWIDAFEKGGFRVLLNRGEKFSHFGRNAFLAGIADPDFEMLGTEHAPDLTRALEGSEEAPFRILLSHRPDFANEAAQKGVDLQLSGHTHGGQFFPWTLVASLVHTYSMGAYQIGKMWVYVSAGTGSWGPRLRLGTRAEVTLIELAK